MTYEETKAFELLDDYPRREHKCFLAEMFLNKTKTEYVLCFRPVNTDRDSNNRYASSYARIAINDIQRVVKASSLPKVISNQLDEKLRTRS